MKYLIYLILGCILFLPEARSAQIRNVPLLIVVLSFIIGLFLVRFFKYIIVINKSKKILKQKGFRCIKHVAFSFASMLHGQYSMLFQSEHKEINIVFLVRKRKYPHYHFRDCNSIEFYRSNRVVFPNIKAYGATISDLVETKLVGKKKIKWQRQTSRTPRIDILLFDRLPLKITASTSKEEIGNGDRICCSNIYLYDVNGLQRAERRLFNE